MVSLWVSHGYASSACAVSYACADAVACRCRDVPPTVPPRGRGPRRPGSGAARPRRRPAPPRPGRPGAVLEPPGGDRLADPSRRRSTGAWPRRDPVRDDRPPAARVGVARSRRAGRPGRPAAGQRLRRHRATASWSSPTTRPPSRAALAEAPGDAHQRRAPHEPRADSGPVRSRTRWSASCSRRSRSGRSAATASIAETMASLADPRFTHYLVSRRRRARPPSPGARRSTA